MTRHSRPPPRQPSLPRAPLSERLIRDVLKSGDAQIVIDRPARVLLINTAAERTFGQLWSEVVGLPAEQLIPRLRSALSRLPRTGGDSGAKLVGRASGGSLLPISVSCRPGFPGRRSGVRVLTVRPRPAR